MAANLSPIENSDVGNDIGNVVVSDIVNVVISFILLLLQFKSIFLYERNMKTMEINKSILFVCIQF